MARQSDAWGHSLAPQPRPGETYLIHDSGNEGSAGWYPADVADVLLRTGEGWHLADPDTGAGLDTGTADVGDTVLDLSTADDTTPPPAETPDGGDADTEKE